MKWIIEPNSVYYDLTGFNPYVDEWVSTAEKRPDYGELQPDLYLVENYALNSFLTEPSIFNSIIPIAKDMVGSAHTHIIDEFEDRSLAGNIGINGAWYHWNFQFGQGSSDPMPDWGSITSAYPRLKLTHVIPNWDNLNNIPLTNRSWDSSVYQSTKDGQPQSYISSDIMYSRHWKNGKLFAVFNTLN